MAKKKQATWQLLLAGCGVSIGIYGAVVLALAYAIINGFVPETMAGIGLTVGAFLSMVAGGLLFGRRMQFGIMGGCWAILGCFWTLLLLLAWCVYGGVVWSSMALALLLGTIAGAILAGILGRKHKGRRIAKRFG